VRNAGQSKLNRLSLSDLPNETLRRLDAITSVDARVYRAAAVRLLCDLAALEEASGKRVLCPSRLHGFRQATAYIAGLWPPAVGKRS